MQTIKEIVWYVIDHQENAEGRDIALDVYFKVLPQAVDKFELFKFTMPFLAQQKSYCVNDSGAGRQR